jgi:hypothetical protein
MEELGLQQDEEYGAMLVVLGGLDLDQGRYKEALVIYDKAKAVLAQHKEANVYGALLSSMGICHQRLQSGARPSHATRKLLSTAATYSATTILSTQPHCTTSPICTPSSTRRPSRDLRRHLPLSRGCSVTSMSAFS